MLTLEASPMNLKLHEPFRISRGVQHYAHCVVAKISAKGVTGFGEAAPTSYYGETQESVLSCLSVYAGHLGSDPFALEDILEEVEHTIGRNGAARAAVDLALH